jgi:hypothetical protein
MSIEVSGNGGAAPVAGNDEIPPVPSRRDGYPTEEAAAHAAMDEVLNQQLSTGKEHGTIVYKAKDGSYYYDKPTIGTDDGQGHNRVAPPVNEQNGSQRAAQVHSHPDGAVIGDHKGDNSNNIRMYVVGYGGERYEFPPNSHKPTEIERPAGPAKPTGPTQQPAGNTAPGKRADEAGANDGVDDPPPDSPFADRVDASQDTKINEEDEQLIDPKGESDNSYGPDGRNKMWA